MKAGFASVCITPPPGKDIPGLFERRLAAGVHDPLYARATVVEDGARCVALVQVDAIAVSEATVKTARALADRSCGMGRPDCLIAATHTHSGGPSVPAFLSQADPAYEDFLAHQIAAAIYEAFRTRQPALTGVGAAMAEGVAFNRRFVMRDGSQRTHPGKRNPDIVEPAGPADPTVLVMGFCEPATLRPLGCIVNFGCHATHMNGTLYSADYPRWVVDTLRGAYGPDFGVVFLNGACGDVTQMDNRSPRPNEFGAYWCERTGRVVGGAAVQALARMDYARDATVDRATTTAHTDIRRLPAADVAAASRLLLENRVTVANIETVYALELLEVRRMRSQQRARMLQIMAVRIGDGMLWSVPAELFQRFALEVREGSPFPFTGCVELANGYQGYICTPEAFAGGGYEIRTARSSFLNPDAGPSVVYAARRLCHKLHQRAVEEMQSLPNRKTWPTVTDTALDGISQLSEKRKQS